MLIVDLDEKSEASLPARGKGVIRNDKLLELMGVAMPEVCSSAGCSAYSLDDEQSGAVAPLHMQSPQQRNQQQTCPPEYDSQLELEVAVNYRNRDDMEELSNGGQYVMEDNSSQKGFFSKTHMNKTSTDLLRRSATFEPDFQTRMKQFLLKNQQKKEKIRQSLVVEEESSAIPIPRINQVQL